MVNYMTLESKYTQVKRLIVGENDLLTYCKEHGEQGQEIINEWDKQKNGSMSNYKAGSSKRVYWKCSLCGETYIKDIRSRVIGRIHEPCGKKRGIERLKEYHRKKVNIDNSLAVKCSELMDEWDYIANEKNELDPTYLLTGSSKKAHWICRQCGNHYQQYIRLRTQQGYGCKQCKKQAKMVLKQRLNL